LAVADWVTSVTVIVCGISTVAVVVLLPYFSVRVLVSVLTLRLVTIGLVLFWDTLEVADEVIDEGSMMVLFWNALDVADEVIDEGPMVVLFWNTLEIGDEVIVEGSMMVLFL
jgi:hypothetical protein